MITRLLQRQRRQVERLSLKLEHEREVLKVLRMEGRAALEEKARSGWALPVCFAAGFASARWGGKLGRMIRKVPLVRMARQFWAHFLV